MEDNQNTDLQQRKEIDTFFKWLIAINTIIIDTFVVVRLFEDFDIVWFLVLLVPSIFASLIVTLILKNLIFLSLYNCIQLFKEERYRKERGTIAAVVVLSLLFITIMVGLVFLGTKLARENNRYSEIYNRNKVGSENTYSKTESIKSDKKSYNVEELDFPIPGMKEKDILSTKLGRTTNIEKCPYFDQYDNSRKNKTYIWYGQAINAKDIKLRGRWFQADVWYKACDADDNGYVLSVAFHDDRGIIHVVDINDDQTELEKCMYNGFWDNKDQ